MGLFSEVKGVWGVEGCEEGSVGKVRVDFDHICRKWDWGGCGLGKSKIHVPPAGKCAVGHSIGGDCVRYSWGLDTQIEGKSRFIGCCGGRQQQATPTNARCRTNSMGPQFARCGQGSQCAKNAGTYFLSRCLK